MIIEPKIPNIDVRCKSCQSEFEIAELDSVEGVHPVRGDNEIRHVWIILWDCPSCDHENEEEPYEEPPPEPLL